MNKAKALQARIDQLEALVAVPIDVDALVDEINEILIYADVDYPAGREAGHSISYDEDALRSAIERCVRAPMTTYTEHPRPIAKGKSDRKIQL